MKRQCKPNILITSYYVIGNREINWLISNRKSSALAGISAWHIKKNDYTDKNGNYSARILDIEKIKTLFENIDTQN